MEQMELRLRVGGEIRRQCEAQSLTLHRLADMIGSSYTHVWKIEHGKVSVRLDTLGRISTALGVPLRDIVDPEPLAPQSTMEYR